MKHVFLDNTYDHGHILMHDLENQKDCLIVYWDRIFKSRFISRWFCRLLYGRIKNCIVFFDKYLWKVLFRNRIDSDTLTITMITGWYSKSLLRYLRDSFPQAKLILILRDTVLSNTQRNKEFKIEEVKQEFDLILSYDSIYDVPQYELTYAPVYISKFDEIAPSSIPRKYDIAFIAEAKDRLKIIHDLYRRFIENGIKCYFYICHAKKAERLNVYDIIYTDKKLGRFKMLRKELEANCILEILKSDAYSNTLRFWEAVMYNRKFYTNWKGVVNSPYYDPRYIRVFENLDDIDYTFIKERVEVDYNYRGELSPIHLLEFLKQLYVE